MAPFFFTLFMILICNYSFKVSSSVTKLNKVGSLNMSPIGMGTWAWGNRLLWNYNQDDDNELKLAYEYSLAQGINWFDTADSYGTGSLSGRSEELLGKFEFEAKAKGKRIKPYYCTKLAPYPWRIGERSMIDAASKSIKRLGRPMDMVQLHWPPSLQWQETQYLKAFSDLVDTKQATQIGLSNFGPVGLTRAYNNLRNFGNVPYSNQVCV